MTTEYKRMQQLRGTSAEWFEDNIVPLDGEFAVERDGSTTKLKIGDGATSYEALPYLLPSGPLHPLGSINAVTTAPPAGADPGDFWINTGTGTVIAGWGAPAAGTAAIPGDMLLLSEAGQWHLIPRNPSGGAGLIDYQRTGMATQPTTQAEYNQRRAHLFDYLPSSINKANLLNNTSTDDLAPYLTAAINDLPASGGVLLLPPCDIRVASPIVIGNGTDTTISTRNGIVIRPDSYGGVDIGTFGGGQRQNSTRLLYVGAAAPAAYLLTVNGPIRNVDIRGMVVDCNGLCGYPFDLTWLINSYIDLYGTRWTTGQGRARVRDVPMPAGITIGMFKNVLKLRTTFPSTGGSTLKRGTQGFQYLGGPANNQGFSKNIIECEHTFDDAGTYAMQLRYIDNNQFREVWTRSSTGESPSVDPTLQGAGTQIVVDEAGPLGENVFTGNFCGGNNGSGGFRSVEYVFNGAATLADKFPDIWTSFALQDYEQPPVNRTAKIIATDGVLHNGITGSLVPIMGRTGMNNMSSTAEEFWCPWGSAPPGVNRFQTDLAVGRAGYLHTFEVFLGIAPGGTGTRTFAIHVNGADVAFIAFGPTESGLKRLATFAPIGLNANAQISVRTIVANNPAVTPAQWSIGFCPVEAIAWS